VRWLIALLLVVAVGRVAGSAVAGRFASPRWPPAAEHQLLEHGFENAKPIRVYYIPYPKRSR